MGKLYYVTVLKKNPSNPMAPKRTYAMAQAQGEVDIDEIAKHMTENGSPFSRGVIKAMASDFVDNIREYLCNGYKVRLGDLGTFRVTLESKGVCESEIDILTGNKPVFGKDDIKEVNAVFIPSKYLKHMIDDCELEETQSKAYKGMSLAEKHKLIVEGKWEGDKALENKEPGVSEID